MSTAESHHDADESDEMDTDADLEQVPDLDNDDFDDDAPIADDDFDDADDDLDVDADDDDDASITEPGDEDDTDDDDDEEEEEEDDDADEDDAEESLDVLLAREKAIDEDDLGRLAEESREGLTVRPALVGAGEFTCRSCYLVKRRAQLADEKRMLCFDCA